MLHSAVGVMGDHESSSDDCGSFARALLALESDSGHEDGWNLVLES